MKREKLSKAAASGAVALIFLVLGFQAAIFTGNVFRSNSDKRVDTVYVLGSVQGSGSLQADADIRTEMLDKPSASAGQRGNSGKSGRGRGAESSFIKKGLAPQEELPYSDSRRAIESRLEKKREPELFRFDPNTVSAEDLVRLGFSERQAQVIENYRNKGGKYYSAKDFAKMYVVDSAMFARLEPYIKVKKLNLNTADSLDLIGLRGIGPYYAHKILQYRSRLGGVFTSMEQLLEIDGFEPERLAGFEQRVELGGGAPRFSLWSATRGELASHPYIGAYAAKGIVRYKSITDTAAWSLEDLVENGVLDAEVAARIAYLDAGGDSYHE